MKSKFICYLFFHCPLKISIKIYALAAAVVVVSAKPDERAEKKGF